MRSRARLRINWRQTRMALEGGKISKDGSKTGKALRDVKWNEADVRYFLCNFLKKCFII